MIFENVRGSKMPVVANLFGTRERCALALGVEDEEFKEIGELIAFLQRPKPPEGKVGGDKEHTVFRKDAHSWPEDRKERSPVRRSS